MTKFEHIVPSSKFQAVLGPIKHVVRHHLKRRQMATRATHCINVRQSNAWLGYRQRIAGGSTAPEVTLG